LSAQQYGRDRDRQNGCHQMYDARPWSGYRYQ
jgi:hypothetical protein